MARRNGAGVRLLTRKWSDLAGRFPPAAAAVAALPVRSCLIDGEAIACDEKGLAVFDLIRGRWHADDVTLCAFDLIELDGRDMRRAPIEDAASTMRKPIASTALARIGPRNFSAACVAPRSGTTTTSPATICSATRKRRHGVRTIGAFRTAIRSGGLLGWRSQIRPALISPATGSGIYLNKEMQLTARSTIL
jgi:hypothetical protein